MLVELQPSFYGLNILKILTGIEAAFFLLTLAERIDEGRFIVVLDLPVLCQSIVKTGKRGRVPYVDHPKPAAPDVAHQYFQIAVESRGNDHLEKLSA